MSLRNFLKPNKPKLIIFGLFVVFEVLVQFLYNKSSNLFSALILLFDTIISIPALIVMSISSLYVSNQLIVTIWFILVNLVWFYLFSSIIFYIYKSIKNRGESSLKNSVVYIFLKLNWIKLLLLVVCFIPLYGIISSFMSLAFMTILAVTVDLIRNINPGYNLDESWLFYMPVLFSVFGIYLVICGFDAIYRRYNSRIFLYVLLGMGLVIDVFLVVFLILPFTKPCKVIERSIAPACSKTEGFCIGGGCFGKSAIKDLKVVPSVDCLQFEINNCNGGILTVTNKCNEDLTIGGLSLPYIKIRERHSKSVDIKLTKNNNGEVVVNVFQNIKSVDGWSLLASQRYKDIAIGGKIGDENFEIAIKNSKLVVDPLIDCLKIRINNLNGVEDSFSVYNNCTDEVWIGDYKLQPAKIITKSPGDPYRLEFVKDSVGKIIVEQKDEINFSTYTPAQDEVLSLPGVVGSQKFTISYTKTKQLCK